MLETKAISDNDLFRQFIENNKDERLFTAILNRFNRKVYWQVRRILIVHDDADEVTQIVFIKLWQNAAQFKFNSALSSFIFRIAYNESITFLNQKKRFTSFDTMLDTDGHYSNMINYGNELTGDEIAKKLQLALLTLPEKQRLVFNYKYFEELQYDEIADITGTSIGALKSSYHIAVEKIKKNLNID